MVKDIDNVFFENQINLSEIGKYGKFIDFEKDQNDHLYFNGLFCFTTNDLNCEKLTQNQMDSALDSMYYSLKDGIEKQLEEQLSEKIKEINEKARIKIEKLKEKPRKKLKKLNGFEILEDSYIKLFNRNRIKLNSSEVSPSVS